MERYRTRLNPSIGAWHWMSQASAGVGCLCRSLTIVPFRSRLSFVEALTSLIDNGRSSLQSNLQEQSDVFCSPVRRQSSFTEAAMSDVRVLLRLRYHASN